MTAALELRVEVALMVCAMVAHTMLFGRQRIPAKVAKAFSVTKHIETPPSTKSARQQKPASQRKTTVAAKSVADEALTAAVNKADLDAAIAALEPHVASTGNKHIQHVRQLISLLDDESKVSTLADFLAKHEPLCKAENFNQLLSHCIMKGKLSSLEEVARKAIELKAANAITYSALVKGLLRGKQLVEAQKALQAMRDAGLAPDVFTFNEVIHACVVAGDTESVRRMLLQMRSDGAHPNNSTIATVLKGVQQDNKGIRMSEALQLTKEIDEKEMDVVLLSAILEACIRSERADLLSPFLKKYWEPCSIKVTSAPLFGSVIRSYGLAHNLQGACRTWQAMRDSAIPPTSMVLGCMLEAYAANSKPDEAHALLRSLLGAEETRHLVNAVNYCSILKGYSQLKRFDRVWAVYEEMIAAGFKDQFTAVTYNTVINACAGCNKLHMALELVEEMDRQKVAPTRITYSAILKGYCVNNQLDEAFNVMELMKQSEHTMPDELAYNSLLDGCARQGLYDRGMELFREMEAEGVRPSNFTLSVLVKLANRARQYDQGFKVCEEVQQKYGVQLNAHVYANLIQGCVNSKKCEHALKILETMIAARVQPLPRCYQLLITGHLDAKQPEMAVELVRTALGRGTSIPGVNDTPVLQNFARLRLLGRDEPPLPEAFLSEVLATLRHSMRRPDLAALLSAELRKR